MLGDFLTARCGTELPVGAANRNIRLRRHRSFVNPLKSFPRPGLLASRESLVLCENIMKPPLASPPLRAAQPITQWYRAETTVVEYHPQRIGPALDVAPHNPVIQTEIFPRRPIGFGTVFSGREQGNLVQALVAIRYAKLPRHPAAILAIGARQKDKSLSLPDSGLQDTCSFLARVGWHLWIDLVDINPGSMAFEHLNCANDQLLVLARMRQEGRALEWSRTGGFPQARLLGDGQISRISAKFSLGDKSDHVTSPNCLSMKSSPDIEPELASVANPLENGVDKIDKIAGAGRCV